ncbi:MAG: BrnT family toxin [Pyrinomonadaceae bacterium]|nr:BrnT family toxin [Pyrinomonadaceae bacterium]
MDISYTLQDIRFEWDETKADSNIEKHKVSFETSCEVFFDPFLQSKEVELIDNELREVIVGATENLRLLYVAYTLRDDKIRIISARNVTKKERNEYENQ